VITHGDNDNDNDGDTDDEGVLLERLMDCISKLDDDLPTIIDDDDDDDNVDNDETNNNKFQSAVDFISTYLFLQTHNDDDDDENDDDRGGHERSSSSSSSSSHPAEMTIDNDVTTTRVVRVNDDTNGMMMEWKAGLILLSRILNPQLVGTTTITTADDVDRSNTNRRSSSIVAPHELLYIAVGQSNSHGDDDDDGGHNHHDGDRSIRTRMPSTTTTTSQTQRSAQRQQQRLYSLKSSLYTLLACSSIHSAASATQNATTSSSQHPQQQQQQQQRQTTDQKVIRWKRLQSMCMSCIELYQRSILSKFDQSFQPHHHHHHHGHASVSRHDDHEESNDLILQQHLRGAMTVYCRHLVPSIYFMLSVLQDAAASAAAAVLDNAQPSSSSSSRNNNKTKGGPDKILIRSIQAGVISTATTLAKHIATHMIGTDDKMVTTMGRIWIANIHESLLKGNLLDRFESIWIHPIRKYRHVSHLKNRIQYAVTTVVTDGDEIIEKNDRRRDGDREEEEEESIIDLHARERILRELTPLLICTDDDFDSWNDTTNNNNNNNTLTNAKICKAALCGMNLSWDDDGLAILAHSTMLHLVLHDDDDDDESLYQSSSSTIPTVYSPAMLLTLFFPHVTKLFEMSQRTTELEIDEDDGGPNVQSSARFKVLEDRRRMEYFVMGMQLLKNLLSRAGESSNRCPLFSGFLLNDGIRLDEEAHNRSTEPLNPFGMIQLLFNQVVNFSQSRNAGMTHCREKRYYYSVPEIIAVIRQVLQLHGAYRQTLCIGKLIKLCPHSFLVPILLDILRSSSVHEADQSEEMIKSHKEILIILNPFIKDMKSCVIMDDIKTSISITVFNKVTTLQENAEVFLSTVSLLRLLYLQQQSSSLLRDCKGIRTVKQELDDAINVSTCLYTTLHAALQEWSQDVPSNEENVPNIYGSPPDEHFRLNLLDYALKEMLEIIV